MATLYTLPNLKEFTYHDIWEHTLNIRLTIVNVCINSTACMLPQIAGYTLPYDELIEIRERLGEIAPHLTRYDDIEPANFFTLAEKLVKVHNIEWNPSKPDTIGTD